MTDSRQSDLDELAELVSFASRADAAARDAYEAIGPQSQAARYARGAVMWKAAQIILADPEQAAEVATQLAYDGRLTSVEADYISRDIAQAIQWHLREILTRALLSE